MYYRQFGRTGKKISEIGHGTWTMGSMWGALDDQQALASLKLGIDQGINFIDTALVYGQGHSEQLIGQVLKEIKKDIFVATKVPPKNNQWPARHHVPVEEAFPEDTIIKCTEKSLRNLGVDCIDLQQLHVWSHNWMNKGDWLGAIEKLKAQGKIKYFGISINDHEPDTALELVESGLIDSVQVIYNVFDQSPEEKLFPLCQKKNVAVIARVPFDEGSLTGTFTPETKFEKGDWRALYFTPERLPETCDRIKAIKQVMSHEIESLPQMALKFCLSHPAVSTVIPGMRKINHVKENCAASDGKLLSIELLTVLKKHAWLRNFYPKHG